MTEDRLTRIEELLAHQTAALEDMSDVLRRQDLAIEALERRVTLLMRRAAEAETDNGGTAPLADQRPPHY